LIRYDVHGNGIVMNGTALQAFDFASLARVGLSAVCGLWLDETASFRQSSIDSDKRLRPTVTFRCADVLFAVAADQPELVREHRDVLAAVADRVVRMEPQEAEDASTLSYVPYTAALLTLATARVAAGATGSADRARARLPELGAYLRSRLPAEQLPAIHPFVQEHALRAALATRMVLGGEPSLDSYIAALQASIAQAVERLLARHHAALITPAESVVLVFCAAALSSVGAARDDQLALAALAAAASAQDISGSWPLGRVVRDEPSRLEISTYEVAWAVTDTLTRLLGRLASKDPVEVATVLEAIGRASGFAERSVVELPDGTRGWSSDHPYEQPRIESWTSAIAVQFALAGEKLRDHIRNRDVLRSFTTMTPHNADWPSWLRWDNLAQASEPDAEYPIYEYLERRVIQRIERHPQRLPSGTDETASVLLFGPPGTSKTTIVQAVADRLSWPMVILSPGNFIEQGLEAIEAAARSVFDRLQALRQVVVIFDECDELFRDRRPSKSTEQVRNISAFVTASMLPKLQVLHDRGKVLFFICTNHADMMDPAVLRGGRMDHRIGVGPPDKRARTTIINGFRHELPKIEHLDAVLEELAYRAERFSRGELKRAALKLAAEGSWEDEKQAVRTVQSVVEEMQDALTISDEMMTQFLEQQHKMSDPYREKAS
jgi:hypothetical protein